MKRLFLLRHAKSSWDDPKLDDIDRPLAKRGREAAGLMGRHMAEAGWQPDVTLCSSARRARETFERVEKAFGTGLPSSIEEGLYHAGAEDLFQRVRDADEAFTTLLLIGHNPAMQDFACRLVGGGEPEGRRRMTAKFPTAALAVVRSEIDSWRDLEAGVGILEAFIRPRDLAD